MDFVYRFLSTPGRALGRYELLPSVCLRRDTDVVHFEAMVAGRNSAPPWSWKRMRPENAADPRSREKLFIREARLSMSLVHQNIVPVFDFGKIDDQVFFAMERVEGKDLGLQPDGCRAAKCRRRSPRSSPPSAARRSRPTRIRGKGPDGVALGIVHRDVTPRNILLSWSGEVKLTDFDRRAGRMMLTRGCSARRITWRWSRRGASRSIRGADVYAIVPVCCARRGRPAHARARATDYEDDPRGGAPRRAGAGGRTPTLAGSDRLGSRGAARDRRPRDRGAAHDRYPGRALDARRSRCHRRAIAPRTR